MAATLDTRDAPVFHEEKQGKVERTENIGTPEVVHHASLDYTTKTMLIFSMWIGFAGWALQFDLGYTGIVLRMTPFNEAFGHCAMKTLHEGPTSVTRRVCELNATAQSLQSSIHLLFMALGAGVAGITGHYLGRRRTLQLGCLIIIVGAGGMLGCSGNLAAYIACKCIGAFGIGHLQSAAPAYSVECCPPSKRGMLVTFYAVGSGFGGLVVSLICLGSAKIDNDWAWKTPIICQIPVALIYGCGIFFFPESPRWLLTKGNEQGARSSFSRLYNREPDSSEVTAQVAQVRGAIELEKAISSTTSWTEIFHRNFIRRTLTSVAIVVGAPICGTFFVFTYAAIFLSSVGISNPITIVVILNTTTFAGVLLGPLIVEYLGRRRTILIGYGGTASCMLIFAAVSSAVGASTSVSRNTVIAFLCIWAFIFGAFIASSLWTTSGEMHALQHRTYAQAFITVVSNIFTFATNFWTPYMINPAYGNMGTNVGYFYFGLELITMGILFFLVPETGRLSLEQIDAYFSSGESAWRTSLAKNKKISNRGFVVERP